MNYLNRSDIMQFDSKKPISQRETVPTEFQTLYEEDLPVRSKEFGRFSIQQSRQKAYREKGWTKFVHLAMGWVHPNGNNYIPKQNRPDGKGKNCRINLPYDKYYISWVVIKFLEVLLRMYDKDEQVGYKDKIDEVFRVNEKVE